jgi:hypothetical protein
LRAERFAFHFHAGYILRVGSSAEG